VTSITNIIGVWGWKIKANARDVSIQVCGCFHSSGGKKQCNSAVVFVGCF